MSDNDNANDLKIIIIIIINKNDKNNHHHNCEKAFISNTIPNLKDIHWGLNNWKPNKICNSSLEQKLEQKQLVQLILSIYKFQSR